MLLATLENPSLTNTIGPGQELVLPAPFSWVTLEPGASVTLPVTAEELAERDENSGFSPGQLLQILVQAGVLIVTFNLDSTRPHPTTDEAIATLSSGLPPFTNEQFAALIENPGSIPVFQRLTEDMILPGWSLTASVTPSVVEIGATVTNASLTFSYTRPAEAATIDDGSGPVALVSPFTSYIAPGPYVKTAINDSVVFTLTANEPGFTSKMTTTSISWQVLVFYGEEVPPGSYTEAFIEGLAGSALASESARTISYNAAAGEKLYYAIPSVFGTPTFTDAATDFAAGFSMAAAGVSVTNSLGVTNGYDVWESDQSGLGAVTINVT